MAQGNPHMAESDALSWYMERDPLLRSTIVVVLVLDRSPDPEVLRERADRASRLVPGLRHRVFEPPLRLTPPRWVVDADFDLSWHVRHIEAPHPRTLAGVLDLARITGTAGFDRARPMWEWTVAHGLENGQAAVVLKFHHALTDGVGAMQLAATLFDTQRDAEDPGPMPDAPKPELPSLVNALSDVTHYQWDRASRFARRHAASVVEQAEQALRHPIDATDRVIETLRSVAKTVRPVTDTKSPIMVERHLGRHYDVLEFALDDLQRAARSAHGTINDAFLAGVAGALRRYHERHDSHCDELRVTLPISLRDEGDPIGGNRVTLMRFGVPAGIEDPALRMRAIHDLALEARTEPSIPLTNAIATALNLLPPRLVGGMLKHVDFVATNVPGLTTPLYVGGARLERFYSFAPTIGASVNLSLLSYCGTCTIGVNADTGAVPDPEILMDCLGEEFESVLDLGGDHRPVVFPTRAGAE
jgi:diacylglycerol O-acyltransferase / wax synthase